jgi:hypothetical protein
MAHCHLKALIESSKIKKIGIALKTFYTAINEDIAVINYQLEEKLNRLLPRFFSLLSPQAKSYQVLLVLKNGVANGALTPIKLLASPKRHKTQAKLLVLLLRVV